jgi:hypothetical protein
VTGFEPATGMEAIALPAVSYDNQPPRYAALALQTSDMKCPWLSSFDADLRCVIEAWAIMPDETRWTVLALVNATPTPGR